jgi:hypothetical protein
VFTLEAKMIVYSVDIFFSQASGAARLFTVSFRNALNASEIVVQQFADDCSNAFDKLSQFEALGSSVETYCTPINGARAHSADFTLGRNLQDPMVCVCGCVCVI